MKDYKKYKKKPIAIYAKKYIGDKAKIIKTLEGDMMLHPGNYEVIRVDGERYPVKASIFEKTYDLIDED